MDEHLNDKQKCKEKDFYIINTHMDAGRSDSDRYAREKQLEHIVSAINKKKDIIIEIKIIRIMYLQIT